VSEATKNFKDSIKILEGEGKDDNDDDDVEDLELNRGQSELFKG
jgi:hypothetical protein